jgi:hypothetical protein
VVNRIDAVRDNAAGTQQPVPAGISIVFIRRQRGASSGDCKGRRESNFDQHFSFSKLRWFAAHKMMLFDRLDKGSMP